jgi:serine/threonine protein phosphatase PrpC
MGAEAAGRRGFPGSTAAVVMVAPGRVAAANVGDSRAVVCRGGVAVALTSDQTADREDERARIVAAGGSVSMRMGSWRVGEAGMQVTRSVGDADLKRHGVTAEAEVTEMALTGGVGWGGVSRGCGVGMCMGRGGASIPCVQSLGTASGDWQCRT